MLLPTLPQAEQDETQERTNLRTHGSLVELCRAMVQHASAARSRVISASLADVVLDTMFCQHLLSPVDDLRLHVSILQLLDQMLQHDERKMVALMAQPRTFGTLKWITAHLPKESSLPDVQRAHALLQAVPGVVGLATIEEVKFVEALQVQMLVHLLSLLTRLLPAIHRFNGAEGMPLDLRESIDPSSFTRLFNATQLCFLAAQPLPELRGQTASSRGFLLEPGAIMFLISSDPCSCYCVFQRLSFLSAHAL
jgi:hypothetical protein